jgi:hypothetical protein
MSDISPSPDRKPETWAVVLTVIIVVGILLAICALFAWGFLELIKAVSHAWHEGAK